jgi:hypothetical protein
MGDGFIEMKMRGLMVMTIYTYSSEHDGLIDRNHVYFIEYSANFTRSLTPWDKTWAARIYGMFLRPS